eukprot:CAMPEP_0177663134 /NCGR_PEP_ID=MMETSP0447-20121125/19747_1 /TAXON_ID=0 /ORGANISM="Stygamoeba regulata, Strain BSH-02190019" /LENGTH=94 /DNA_ID=CAMNT_0019168917 /DNA_START=72 /DNA_END=356 /DNA_ORIENTATION=-
MIPATRLALTRAGAAGFRRYSSGIPDPVKSKKTMDLWKIVSIGGVVPAVIIGVIAMKNEAAHHPEPRKEMSFMNIRHKDFPWGPEPLLGIPEHH